MEFRLAHYSALFSADVSHLFREGVLLFFLEGPGGFEMIVVDKRVHRVMHVPITGILQVRDAHQVKGARRSKLSSSLSSIISSQVLFLSKMDHAKSEA